MLLFGLLFISGGSAQNQGEQLEKSIFMKYTFQVVSKSFYNNVSTISMVSHFLLQSYFHNHQGKCWWVAMVVLLGTSQAWSCSLPPTPAPSPTCLNQGMAPAFPSCLGGALGGPGWSSVGDAVVLACLTLASPGLQATKAGLPCTQ